MRGGDLSRSHSLEAPMVIHTQVDWRTLPQALEWDVALVRGVFWNIYKQYDAESHAKLMRQKHHEVDDNQAMEREQPPTQMEEHRLVSKADVLIGIKTTEHFLDKRPFLRSLYTILACCSNEKEMASVGNYVKFRLRERTISFAMVRAKLQDIYTKHMDLVAFEARVQEFKAAARAKSTWCVRDPKAICKSPSQFYGVHNIPPKPKTKKQVEMELQLVKAHASAVATNAISLVLSQLIDAARPKSRQRSAKSRRSSVSRGGTPAEEAAKAVRAARVRQKRDKQQADARCKELRLQILVPGILRTQETSAFGVLRTPHEENDGTPHRPSDKTIRQQELLALVEASGDLNIAQQLLNHMIPRSGFSRVTEHLTNLSSTGSEHKVDESPDEWDVFKLWKTVYRSRTIQSIQRLEH